MPEEMGLAEAVAMAAMVGSEADEQVPNRDENSEEDGDNKKKSLKTI